MKDAGVRSSIAVFSRSSAAAEFIALHLGGATTIGELDRLKGRP